MSRECDAATLGGPGLRARTPWGSACALIVAIAALGACDRSSGARDIGSAAAPSADASVALPAARVEELRAIVRRIDAVAAVEADAARVEQSLPPWVFSRGGAIVEPVDDRARHELRTILHARDLDARVRAVAVLRLAAAFDLADVTTLALLVDETADAGKFPLEGHSPQLFGAARPIRWGSLTLGGAARRGLGTLTGADLATKADVERWFRENPEPRSSFSYWEKTLEQQHETTRKARLTTLRDANPQLFVRVLLADKQRSHFAWWDQEDLVRVVRERVGVARMLRQLGRQDLFPELAEPDRFDAFAAWTLDHADQLFTASNAAGLLAAWEKEGARYPSNDTASKLALVAARWNPTERPRIVEQSLRYLGQFRDRVVADAVEHGLPAEAERVARWFRSEGLSTEARIEVRKGVLKGLGALGAAGRPHLANLLRGEGAARESDEIIVALVAAVTAMGAKDVCPDAAALESPSLRKPSRERPPAAATEGPDRMRRADRARRECVPRVTRWLAESASRSPGSR